MNQINIFYCEFFDYVDSVKKNKIKEKYIITYKKLRRKLFRNKIEKKFVHDYKNLDKYVDKYNEKYINNIISKDIIKKVNGCELDYNQKKAIITDEVNNLIIAGAGSGKTLTIVGKIRYLIDEKNINPLDILCISFTNEACNSLKKKINNNIEVLTFHKLALNILNKKNLLITNTSLEYVVDEYFYSIIYNNPKMILIVLKLLNIKVKKNYIIEYNKILNCNSLKALKKTIITFINLFKANNYSLDKILKIKRKDNKHLLNLIIDIYYLYQGELKSQYEIDFNDMINKATEYIIENNIILKYKYIIIDEYQDTSYTRYRLIKAIKDYCGAKLMAVGDDWQSIYKFTGCNLDIFLNFEKYFGVTKRIIINNTYRNSQELIDVASKFIERNKYQIKKKLYSKKNLYKPIKIVYEDEKILEKLFDTILDINNIMILGRNNNDINNYLTDNIYKEKDKIIYKKNKQLNIRYLTIHKSKGLEEECVFIINLKDDILGIPSKIQNNKIIDDISNKSHYLYEEERRLFYVALTRTKGYVYLVIPKDKYSLFVREIIKNNRKKIEFLSIN